MPVHRGRVMNLPQEFEDSYIDFQNYPRNLVSKTSSLFALDTFKDHLDEAAPRLCVSSDVDTNVRILDPPLSGGQSQCLPNPTALADF